MILVTGGAGFIGSNLVAALCERGEEVAVCDRFRNGQKWRNLAKHPVADHIHPDAIYDWLDDNSNRIDAVFHMGAISATTECDVDLIMENNFQMTMRLHRWAVENESRLIYASSAATYGDGTRGFSDDESLDSMTALRPLNPYGWSKKLIDVNIKKHAQTGAAPRQWAGLKFFNVYGPNEAHKGDMRSVVHQLYEQIRTTGEAILFKSHHPDYEDGGQMRDFIWVDDCVDMMLWLYDNRQINGIFNCGSGKARSFADLARAVFSALDKPERICFRKTPENIRPHYQYFTEGSIAKIRALGFAGGGTGLEEGVAKYIQNFLCHADSYR